MTLFSSFRSFMTVAMMLSNFHAFLSGILSDVRTIENK